MHFSYSHISSLGIKNPIFCQGSSFTQSRSLNGILLLTDDTKINKSPFDMKQSVVSIGSQYWYDKHYVKDEGKLNLAFFSTLVIILCHNLPFSSADLVFWQPGYTSATFALLQFWQ